MRFAQIRRLRVKRVSDAETKEARVFGQKQLAVARTKLDLTLAKDHQRFLALPKEKIEFHEFHATNNKAYLPYERKAVLTELQATINAMPDPNSRKLYDELLREELRWRKTARKDVSGMVNNGSHSLFAPADDDLSAHLRQRLNDPEMEPIVRRFFGKAGVGAAAYGKVLMSFEAMHERAFLALMDRGAMPARRPLRVDKYPHETKAEWIGKRLIASPFELSLWKWSSVTQVPTIDAAFWRFEFNDEKLLINKKMLAAFISILIGSAFIYTIRKLIPDNFTAPGELLSFLRYNVFELDFYDFFTKTSVGTIGEEGLNLGNGAAFNPFNVRAMEHVPGQPGLRRVPLERARSLQFRFNSPYLTWDADDNIFWYNRNLNEAQIARKPARDDQHERKVNNLVNSPVVEALNKSASVDEFQHNLPSVPSGSTWRGLLYGRLYDDSIQPSSPEKSWNEALAKGKNEEYANNLSRTILDHLNKRDCDELEPANLYTLSNDLIALGLIMAMHLKIRRANHYATLSTAARAHVNVGWMPVKRFERHVNHMPWLERSFREMDEQKVKTIRKLSTLTSGIMLFSTPIRWVLYTSQLDYEDALLSNPIVRLLRDWHYWWHDDYWRAELAQSEYFNLKDAMVVDNHLIFYEQGGPVLKSKCGYDHLGAHRRWFRQITDHEWHPSYLYRSPTTN